MKLINQYIEYEEKLWSVVKLIEASKNLKVFKLKVKDIFTFYSAPNEDNLPSFIEHCINVQNCNLQYPIILSPTNFILDGRHRLVKAIINKKKYIQAVRFENMPNIGEPIEK